ncbi:MAG TPA: head GIN domain-containing protein [Dysgonamonadaceae bacterium]|nr:head GIN domain-containing protein [Dysgonamonadaceae bacterium]
MKKLKVILSLLMFILIATSSTCVQKKVFTDKTYPIQSFSSIKSNVVANIIYTQSNKVSVKAEGDEKMIDNLTISERNGLLEIKTNGKIRNKKKSDLTIYLSSPSIESIENSGVGNFKLNGKIKADNITVNFEGVGNFEASDLESLNIKTNYEGVGNLTLGGTSNLIEIKSEGVGRVNTQNLIAKNAIVISSGVGSVKCYASNSIDIINNGVGSITYYGNPTIKNVENSGVGKVKHGD